MRERLFLACVAPCAHTVPVIKILTNVQLVKCRGSHEFLLTQEQQEIQNLARDFTRAEITAVRLEMDTDHEFPYELWRKLSDLGMAITRAIRRSINLREKPRPRSCAVRSCASKRFSRTALTSRRRCWKRRMRKKKPLSMRRQGSWRVPQHPRVVAVMGGIDLDFREAVFCPDVSEVNITSVMGGVAVIVPPQLNVECSGVGSSAISRAWTKPWPSMSRTHHCCVLPVLRSWAPCNSQADQPARP